MKKFNVVLLDLNGMGMPWLDRYAENVELTETATLDGATGVAINELAGYDGWDYLLVFLPDDAESKELLPKLLDACDIPREKVIYPQNGDSLMGHFAASFFMFNDAIRKIILYMNNRKEHRYLSCSVGELSYIGETSDLAIMRDMYLTGKNWSEEELIRFYELSKRYYQFTEKQKIFCDIGANIGTSCIYFKKKLDGDVHILAFEPMPRIYKMLRINMELNDLAPEVYTLVNCGLSDRRTTQAMSFVPANPGSSNFVYDGADMYETSVVRFDDYLEENNVSPDSLKYIWIDIEGFEAAFCAGAENTLQQINVPIVMEFTPSALRKLDDFDRFMTYMQKLYSKYVTLEDTSCAEHEIGELSRYRYADGSVQFDIFLLK